MKNKKRPRSAIKTTTGSNNRSRIATDPLLMILTAFGALCLVLDVAFAVYAGISVFAAEHGSVIPAAFTPFAASVIAVNALLALCAAIYPFVRRR